MALQRLEIHSREPYEDGTVFGGTGAYERIDGIAHFAVDPLLPANDPIVDLDRAAPGEDGRVQFSADFCLLQPADPAGGNRRLLLDVLNRGNKLAPRQYQRAVSRTPAGTRIEPGDGFLLRRGYTLAWCGWQWDVVRGAALLGLTAPQALDGDGRPLQGQVMVQFQPNAPLGDRLLADRIHQPYPAADVDQPDAELAVRDWSYGERRIIPRNRWRFARNDAGSPQPSNTHVWLDGGFEPGKVYDVIYRTANCPVVGTGPLTTRDFVSFLRYDLDPAANPSAGRIDHTPGFGASQSGRFLRHFLAAGLNLDEQGRQVFDGLHIHIAGGRGGGQFNQRFGQPSDAATAGFGHRFPFSDIKQSDPLTGQSDGVLARLQARGGVPKIIASNTSAEYWRGDGSLAHTDLTTAGDLEPPANVRIYLFAGTQHSSGALPLTAVNALDGARGSHSFNVVDYAPLARAALVNLDRWITTGVEPPPSVFPRHADGTVTTPEQAASAFTSFNGAALPSPERVPSMRRLDFGPDAGSGVGRYPPVIGEPFPCFVSAVDKDGNERGGIRLPDIAVPVATYSGWNPRHPDIGGPGQTLNMLGSTLPFPATAEERIRSGDPRPSIAERYSSRDEYAIRARKAAEDLAERHYLLTEDIDLAVNSALARYDAFSASGEPEAVRSTAAGAAP